MMKKFKKILDETKALREKKIYGTKRPGLKILFLRNQKISELKKFLWLKKFRTSKIFASFIFASHTGKELTDFLISRAFV